MLSGTFWLSILASYRCCRCYRCRAPHRRPCGSQSPQPHRHGQRHNSAVLSAQTSFRVANARSRVTVRGSRIRLVTAAARCDMGGCRPSPSHTAAIRINAHATCEISAVNVCGDETTARTHAAAVGTPAASIDAAAAGARSERGSEVGGGGSVTGLSQGSQLSKSLALATAVHSRVAVDSAATIVVRQCIVSITIVVTESGKVGSVVIATACDGTTVGVVGAKSGAAAPPPPLPPLTAIFDLARRHIARRHRGGQLLLEARGLRRRLHEQRRGLRAAAPSSSTTRAPRGTGRTQVAAGAAVREGRTVLVRVACELGLLAGHGGIEGRCRAGAGQRDGRRCIGRSGGDVGVCGKLRPRIARCGQAGFRGLGD